MTKEGNVIWRRAGLGPRGVTGVLPAPPAAAAPARVPPAPAEQPPRSTAAEDKFDDHPASAPSSGPSDSSPAAKTPYDRDAVEAELKRGARQVKANCGAATDDDGHAISFDPLTGHRLLDATIDAKVGLDTPGDASGHELDAITCHNTRACAAVDTLGDVVTFDPRSRHGARLHCYDSATGLTAISCPNDAMCMATGCPSFVAGSNFHFLTHSTAF